MSMNKLILVSDLHLNID